MSGKRYQDQVIKNGELIADFENVYTKFSDPWNQSTKAQRYSATRVMTQIYVDKLHVDFNSTVILEVGCGLAWLTEDLHNRGFKARGVDISPTCILNALERNPNLDLQSAHFLDERHILDFRPDVIVMSQLSWYVLADLAKFISVVRKLAAFGKPTFLIHSLATYADGVQTYGKEYFTTGEEIKRFFGLSYLFSMETETLEADTRSFDTMFVARL